uniref:Putative HNH homing endonuclease n=1 Tax=viral metagenome TaxID=1070528 RepID=A0A6M3IGM2_9ZZZZ
MITETQKAYLAGLIDGEGCILITAPRTKGEKGWYGHYLTVTVANTNVPVLAWVKSLWKGYLLMRNQPKQRVPVGNLRWTSLQAAQVLKDIRQYLIVKAAQADLAILFAESIEDKGSRINHLPKEEWDSREELRLAIHQLNRPYTVLNKVPYPKEKYQSVCPVCKTTFDRQRKTKVYCSKQCYEKHKWQVHKKGIAS